jgi:hypothetical protein
MAASFPRSSVGTQPVTLCVTHRRSGANGIPTLERGNDTESEGISW